jgi:hypothetical protein
MELFNLLHLAVKNALNTPLQNKKAFYENRRNQNLLFWILLMGENIN